MLPLPSLCYRSSMPFCIEPDHATVGLGLLIVLVEVMKSSKILEPPMVPGIERDTLAFF